MPKTTTRSSRGLQTPYDSPAAERTGIPGRGTTAIQGRVPAVRGPQADVPGIPAECRCSAPEIRQPSASGLNTRSKSVHSPRGTQVACTSPCAQPGSSFRRRANCRSEPFDTPSLGLDDVRVRVAGWASATPTSASTPARSAPATPAPRPRPRDRRLGRRRGSAPRASDRPRRHRSRGDPVRRLRVVPHRS